jgi:hypothetical protein
MTPTPPIETITESMIDNPPVHRNEGMFAANHGIIQKPPAIDTFNTASLSGNGFDAIWQYSSITELLLRRVRHKHTKVVGSILDSRNVYHLGWKANSSTMELTLETYLSSLKMEPS